MPARADPAATGAVPGGHRDTCRLRNATLTDTLAALQADGRVRVEAGRVQLALVWDLPPSGPCSPASVSHAEVLHHARYRAHAQPIRNPEAPPRTLDFEPMARIAHFNWLTDEVRASTARSGSTSRD